MSQKPQNNLKKSSFGAKQRGSDDFLDDEHFNRRRQERLIEDAFRLDMEDRVKRELGQVLLAKEMGERTKKYFNNIHAKFDVAKKFQVIYASQLAMYRVMQEANNELRKMYKKNGEYLERKFPLEIEELINKGLMTKPLSEFEKLLRNKKEEHASLKKDKEKLKNRLKKLKANLQKFESESLKMDKDTNRRDYEYAAPHMKEKHNKLLNEFKDCEGRFNRRKNAVAISSAGLIETQKNHNKKKTKIRDLKRKANTEEMSPSKKRKLGDNSDNDLDMDSH